MAKALRSFVFDDAYSFISFSGDLAVAMFSMKQRDRNEYGFCGIPPTVGRVLRGSLSAGSNDFCQHGKVPCCVWLVRLASGGSGNNGGEQRLCVYATSSGSFNRCEKCTIMVVEGNLSRY